MDKERFREIKRAFSKAILSDNRSFLNVLNLNRTWKEKNIALEEVIDCREIELALPMEGLKIMKYGALKLIREEFIFLMLTQASDMDIPDFSILAENGITPIVVATSDSETDQAVVEREIQRVKEEAKETTMDVEVSRIYPDD